MLIFIPVLIFVALVIVMAGVKIVPQGFQWTVEHHDATTGFKPGVAIYGSDWP